MANGDALPVRIGLLYDFPQAGDLFVKALQLGIDEVAATGRLDRDVEFVERQSRGLPSGSEAEVVRGVRRARDEDVVAIVGPSISDNALIVGAAVRRGAHPGDQLLGRRAHPFAVDVPLPGRLARRGAAGARGAHGRRAGLRRAAVIFDQSPVGRRYAECFEAARARLGLEVTGTASISPLAEDAEALLDAAARRRTRRARLLRARRRVARGRARAPRRSAGTFPCSPTRR